MLDHLIKTARTALTWPFDLAADFMRQTAEGLLDASHALEMLGNIADPNPTSGPWEPGEGDYQHAAELIEQTESLRHPWTETRIYRGDSQWPTADGIAIRTHADGSKTISGPPTDYSDDYTASDAELIRETEDIRLQPMDDYSQWKPAEVNGYSQDALSIPVQQDYPHVRRDYPDGSYDVLSPDGFTQYRPDGSLASHFGAPLNTVPPTDYSDDYTAGDAEVDGYWTNSDA